MFTAFRLALRCLIGHPDRKSRPAARRPVSARLGLEALDDRLAPATLTPLPGWGTPPPVLIAPSPLPTVAVPSPMSLIGKSVSLDSSGTLTISAMTRQPDGSFTFNGTFAAITTLPYGIFRDNIAVVGSITAPRTGGPLITTANIHFHGEAINTGWGYTHHVEYNGALSQGWSTAWTSGHMDACLEYEFDCIGPGRLNVNGTFA